MNVYQAAPGFEKELVRELQFAGCSDFRKEGSFFLAADMGAMAWAEWTGRNVELFSFESIGQAAKFLKAKSKGRWWNASQVERRRSVLISEQVSSPYEKLLHFGEPSRREPFGSFALLSRTELLASAAVEPAEPGGLYRFLENKAAPSRAYLKLWEALTRAGCLPKAGEKALDLGSSPGGWTWVLAELGCEVISVDRAPLAPILQKKKSIQFIMGDAFTQTPERTGNIDWLVSDIICFPEKLFEFVSAWKSSGHCRNFVCTIKFKGDADPVWIERFRSLGGEVLHLCNNKHELTWLFLTR